MLSWRERASASKRQLAFRCRMSGELSFTSGIVTGTASCTIRKLRPESARLIFTLRWPYCFVSRLALARQVDVSEFERHATSAVQCLAKEFAHRQSTGGTEGCGDSLGRRKLSQA